MEKEIYFSSNLRFLRILNKKTLDDIAKYLNKTNSTISKWESGTREPYLEDICLIAEYFNIPVDEIILKDLRLQNIDVKDGNYIIMPKDYKKYKKGDKVPVNEVLEYVDEMQNKIDKIRDNLGI